MSKIKVPEGMGLAAQEAYGPLVGGPQLLRALEAALLWLSENPIVPTEEMIIGEAKATNPLDAIMHIQWIGWWQRRMFLPPEPEAVEDYADKVISSSPTGRTPTHAELDKIWENIFCAGHGWTPPPFRNSNQSVAEVDARIPDLLFSYPTHVTIQTAEDRIRRAYRRGHKDGAK